MSAAAPVYRTLADALAEARRQAASAGGGDVVVHSRAGREIWREHVSRLGHAHPVSTRPREET